MKNIANVITLLSILFLFGIVGGTEQETLSLSTGTILAVICLATAFLSNKIGNAIPKSRISRVKYIVRQTPYVIERRVS